jgi:hypothetical protein
MNFHKRKIGTRGRRSHARVPGTRTVALGLLVLLAGLCAGGCQTQSDPWAMAGSYYLNPHKDLRKLGRVALVELEDNSSSREVPAHVTRALYLAIQKKQLFSLTTIARSDPAWRGLEENVESLQTLRRLTATRESLNCNALLVGTITEYEPYPRMVLGLRLKMLDLTDGQLLWGLEQVWDSADRTIQKRIRTYSQKEVRSGYTPLREEMVVVSSLEFARFAAYEVAETLDRDRGQP